MQHIGYNFAFCIRVFWRNLKITGIENIPKEKAAASISSVERPPTSF